MQQISLPGEMRTQHVPGLQAARYRIEEREGIGRCLGDLQRHAEKARVVQEVGPPAREGCWFESGSGA